VFAATSFYIPHESNYTISFGCKINGAVCTNNTNCNITIRYPNSSFLINNKITRNLNNSIFEFNLEDNQTTPKGEYTSTVVCFSGGYNGTDSFIYEVNPPGIRPTEQRTESITRSIYFMFGIGILLFVAFLFASSSPPVKWTFFIFSILFFLTGLNIILVGLQDEVVNPKLENLFDGLTAISFLFYWFCAFILILMWFLTFISTWILKNNLKNLKRYGLA